MYIYFFLCANFFAQSGEVIYEAKIKTIDIVEKINNDSISEVQERYLKSVFKNQSNAYYILTFNKNHSIFEQQKPLKEEKKTLNFAERKMGKGAFFSNKLAKQIINKKIYIDEEFLIEIPAFQWKLSQEHKKIGDYTCYKATTIKYVEGRNGKMVRKVTAWYSPEIPYNFGPKDYNGLPGLILELEEDNLTIIATKIALFPDKKIEIEKPEKGKKITQKEYDSIVKEAYYKRRRN